MGFHFDRTFLFTQWRKFSGVIQGIEKCFINASKKRKEMRREKMERNQSVRHSSYLKGKRLVKNLLERQRTFHSIQFHSTFKPVKGCHIIIFQDKLRSTVVILFFLFFFFGRSRNILKIAIDKTQVTTPINIEQQNS